MKRNLLLLFAVLLLILGSQNIYSNSDLQQPVPTLISPTPVPQPETGIEEILPSESTVSRIVANGLVRVGILYNAPPFGELNIRGELTGYDADLAQSLAETWGVEVEFVQVTRQVENSAHLLRTGQLDVLISALVHRREYDTLMEFSKTYFLGRQALMVRADDDAQTPADLSNRSVGVVVATAASEALNRWNARNNMNASVQTYLTLDRAYVALVTGEIDGVVDSGYRLQQVSAQRPELTRILNAPVESEPFAVGILRQDAPMRELVNRTLQYLIVTGRMNEIHQKYFPGETYAAVRVWDNLGENAPVPAEYSTTIGYPAQYIVPQIQSTRVIRIAGLYGVTADSDAPESQKRLDTYHRTLLDEMASRWDAVVEYIPATAPDAINLVANGEADLAVGIAPDWLWADQVDFTAPYLVHGDRLMVRIDDEINRFVDLQSGSVLITPNNQENAATRAVQIAESPDVNRRIEITPVREDDLAFSMLAEESEVDADAAFGDSLKLIPHVQTNPQLLRLTLDDDGSARWYSPSNVLNQDFGSRIMVMAVPQNDIDFRLLVEYTLQELAQDGTLSRIAGPVMMPEDVPPLEIWPGSSNYFGFSLNTP